MSKGCCHCNQFWDYNCYNWLCEVKKTATRQLLAEGSGLSGWPTECRYCQYLAHRARGHGNHFLAFFIWGAHWRHLANTTKPSVCCGDAALCQITLTTCYYYSNNTAVLVFCIQNIHQNITMTTCTSTAAHLKRFVPNMYALCACSGRQEGARREAQNRRPRQAIRHRSTTHVTRALMTLLSISSTSTDQLTAVESTTNTTVVWRSRSLSPRLHPGEVLKSYKN